MANIQLIDTPEQLLVSDEEVAPGKTVTTWTWLHVSHLLNFLNYYGRRVLPYTRWNCYFEAPAAELSVVFPVDNSEGTYLTVVLGLTWLDLDEGLGWVKVKSSTNPTGKILNLSTLGSIAMSYGIDEGCIHYVPVRIAVTASQRELITVTSNFRIDGIGAWQLPPAAGGADIAESNGGLQFAGASISDAVGLDPAKFFPLCDIDVDVGDLQIALANAWMLNRRILWSGGMYDPISGDHDELDVTGSVGVWTAGPEGGIYVPEYLSRPGDAYRKIRVAAHCLNTSIGASYLRVVTSRGYFPSAAGLALSPGLSEWAGFSTPFDPMANGIMAEVGVAAERITLEIYPTIGGTAHAYQAVIWEDEPPPPPAMTDLGTIDSTTEAYALEMFDGVLHIGTGDGESPDLGCVYAYSGGSYVDTSFPASAAVRSLAVLGTKLYGSRYTYSPSTTDHVWEYDGATWTDIGHPGGFIWRIVAFDGDLYASTSGPGFYRWTGGTTWVDAGSPGSVILCFAELSGVLYAGCSNGHVYAYDGSSSWTDLGIPTAGCSISSLVAFKGSLYAGLWAGYSAVNIYRWDGGTTWTARGSTGYGNRVWSLAAWKGRLWASKNCGYDAPALWVFDEGAGSWSGIEVPDADQVYALLAGETLLYLGTNQYSTSQAKAFSYHD